MAYEVAMLTLQTQVRRGGPWLLATLLSDIAGVDYLASAATNQRVNGALLAPSRLT